MCEDLKIELVECFEHSPGPWTVSESVVNGALLIKPVPGQVICELDPLPEAGANAKLIAAAPRMLKALQMVIENAPDKFHIPTWDECLGAIQDATK